jgi:hypothetical protein
VIGFHIKETLRGLAVLLFFAALILVGLRIMAGCTPRDTLPVENALAVKQYDDALVECQQAARQRPKEQRFEAYTDCEQAVSKHFCAESQELRREWKRCAELGMGE